MENCLVTTLKGIVNNNDLSYFGYIRVDVNIANGASIEERFLRYRYSAGGTAKIVGNGHFTNGAGTADLGKEVSFTPDAAEGISVFGSSGEYTLLIPKANLLALSANYNNNGLFKVCAEDISYLDVLRELYWTNGSGKDVLNLNDLHYTQKMTKLVLLKSDERVYGSLGQLDLSEATDVRIAGTAASNVTGNLIDLATEHIDTLYINGNSITPCTLEAFIQKIRNNGQGKVSGTINWVYFSTDTLAGFTIGGEEIRSLNINNAGTINWTATTINITAGGQIIREVTA